MRIILIGPTYPFRGGISHYTTLLYRCLCKRHDVTFISFKRQYPRLFFPGKTDKDPSLTPIRTEGVVRMIDSMNPATWISTAAAVVKNDPDLVIIPWWVSFWAPQFWTISTLVKHFSKTKILYICHNLVEHESKWVDKILTRVVLRTGDFFIVHSEEDRRGLLTRFPEAKVKKSFHPTYEVFDSDSVDPDSVHQRHSLKGKIILFFGFIRDYKGLEYLIRAFPEVLSEMEATLLVVGEFWKDKPRYLSLVEKMGVGDHVVFVDSYLPNEAVGDYFAACDLVVQPYTSATGSGVIQIAFGFNTPVVATRVGCLSEVVKDGETGFLVRPRASHEIAQAVLRFFRENRAEEFRHNIEQKNDRFSWDRMVDVIESFQT